MILRSNAGRCVYRAGCTRCVLGRLLLRFSPVRSVLVCRVRIAFSCARLWIAARLNRRVLRGSLPLRISMDARVPRVWSQISVAFAVAFHLPG